MASRSGAIRANRRHERACPRMSRGSCLRSRVQVVLPPVPRGSDLASGQEEGLEWKLNWGVLRDVGFVPDYANVPKGLNVADMDPVRPRRIMLWILFIVFALLLGYVVYRVGNLDTWRPGQEKLLNEQEESPFRFF